MDLSSSAQKFLDYYLSIKGKGLPTMDEFDLLEIPELVPSINLFDVHILEKSITLRMVGSRSRGFSKSDLTGMNVLEAYSPDERASAWEVTFTSLSHPCGSYQVNEVVYPDASSRNVMMLSVPLRPTDDGLHHFAMYFEDKELTLASQNLDQPVQARQSTINDWLDVGFGVPNAAAPVRTEGD